MADLSSTKVFGKLTVIHNAILKANAEITGNATVTGTIAGDGSLITAINASNLASGTVPEARLPASALIGDTTYTAGAGITLTGTTFALTDEAYTTTEKNKLGGIESGATADQTASEILTAIKTVDGSTSGLDADLLDGQHASAFALSGHIHNYDNYGGWTLLTDGTSRGSITSGENVNFVGGSNVSLTYSTTNNAITINSTDTNTDTTYTAGAGIDLTGTSFSLTDESYTTTEKNKLSGIESGATADQTSSEILTSIKTVDGSGSGLDADTVDGQHASAFVNKTSSTGSAVVPSGTEAQRDGTPSAGYLRFNSDTGLFEGYNGTGWVAVGAGATGSAGDQVFVENDQVVTSNYTIPSDKNAMTTGPITIQDGVTVTVSDGARWVVI